VSALLRHKLVHAAVAVVCLLALSGATVAFAQDPAGGSNVTGGAQFIPPPPPPKKAKIWAGKAIAPRSAPRRVKRVIRAANKIVGKPYVYGGGHRAYTSVLDRGYDCSGSVSFALHGGRFIRHPLASTDFMDWGQPGPGRWITVYANGGHAYVYVAGLRFDTSLRDDPHHTGPAWSKRLRRNASYVPRHPKRY
jgi:hypothetical protein